MNDILVAEMIRGINHYEESAYLAHIETPMGGNPGVYLYLWADNGEDGEASGAFAYFTEKDATKLYKAIKKVLKAHGNS